MFTVLSQNADKSKGAPTVIYMYCTRTCTAMVKRLKSIIKSVRLFADEIYDENCFTSFVFYYFIFFLLIPKISLNHEIVG